MMSGTNSASTTAFVDLVLEAPIAVAVSISPRNSAVSQPARFWIIRQNAISMYGSSRASESADALDFLRSPPLRRRRSTSSIVTMPMSMPARVGDRQRRAVVLPEHRDRRFLIVGRLERDEAAVHQVATRARRATVEQELANADVVDERALVVDDVDDVERFAVLPVLAHVVEHLLNGPVLAHRDVVRRHQAADRDPSG